MSNNTQLVTTSVFCNHCKLRTKHELIATHASEYTEWDATDDEDFPIYTEDFEWNLWKCRGCETALLQKKTHFHGNEDAQGNPVHSFEYFPARSEFSYKERHFLKLPSQIAVIYKESCASYNAKLPLLCAGGLRALMEAICRNKNAPGNNLYQRIDGLKTLLPESLVQNLHSLRYLGNDALHELKPPAMSDLRLGLEILGDLMNYFYDLDYKASSLASRKKASVLPVPNNVIPPSLGDSSPEGNGV